MTLEDMAFEQACGAASCMTLCKNAEVCNCRTVAKAVLALVREEQMKANLSAATLLDIQMWWSSQAA